MKASSAVVIIFFIVIWAGNTVWEKSNLTEQPLKKYTKKLDHFSVIVAQPGSKVFVQNQGDSSRETYFSYTIGEGLFYNFNSFGVRNDTLFVFASSSEEEHRYDSFYCQGIKSVIGMENSDIQLWFVHADSLDLKLVHAKLRGQFNNNPEKKSSVLTLVAERSKIDFKNFPSFNRINLELDRSHFNLPDNRTDIININGTIKNYSRLKYVEFKTRGKVEKDETSYSNL